MRSVSAFLTTVLFLVCAVLTHPSPVSAEQVRYDYDAENFDDISVHTALLSEEPVLGPTAETAEFITEARVPVRPSAGLVAPNSVPARFIDSGGTIIDRTSVRSYISPQKQGRHILGDDLYNGGGYFTDASSAQNVLDAFHDGSGQILGVTRNGHIVVQVPSITGCNNNPLNGYVDQVTDVFFIKGSSSPSVVPANPGRTP